MKSVISIIVSVLAIQMGQAFPPAPHHEIYGTVRDSKGNPLSQKATVILRGTSGELLRSPVDAAIAPGTNYSLKVPMDSGTLQQLYQPTAMQPTMPFTITVLIGGILYLPIEITSDTPKMGVAAQRTRLDLTLGIDSDGDGLPDSWEHDVVGANKQDGLETLAHVRPEDDLDGDGISNLGEYLAGTYAFDREDRLKLEIMDVSQGRAHLRFLALTGRSYTLQNSADGKHFAQARFTTSSSSGTADIDTYQAVGIEYVDIYTPVADSVIQMFFVLDVK